MLKCIRRVCQGVCDHGCQVPQEAKERQLKKSRRIMWSVEYYYPQKNHFTTLIKKGIVGNWNGGWYLVANRWDLDDLGDFIDYKKKFLHKIEGGKIMDSMRLRYLKCWTIFKEK